MKVRLALRQSRKMLKENRGSLLLLVVLGMTIPLFYGFRSSFETAIFSLIALFVLGGIGLAITILTD